MEQMLRMSARTADGIMLSDLPSELAAMTLASVAGNLRECDRSPHEFWTSAFAAWHVYDDADRARREARQWLLLRGLFRPWVLQKILSAADIDVVMSHKRSFLTAYLKKTHVIKDVPDRIVDALVDHLTLTGSINDLDRIIEELRRYKTAGLAGISLRLYTDPAASIRLLGERVLPALKD
jgi:alkanesulfonate monooxygenase SsuD/methylene tetrahydromethanopterin reductase-like flavin-dependent oxidoreductase (luciferase family)